MRNKTFVEPHGLGEIPEEKIKQWELFNNRPIKLYKFLRTRPSGRVKYRDISTTIGMSPISVSENLRFLEEHNFVIQKTEQNDRYLCLQDVPPYQKALRNISKSVGKIPVIMEEPATKQEVEEQLLTFYPEMVTFVDCAKVYLGLVKHESNTIFVQDLYPTMKRHSIANHLAQLENAGLIWRFDDLILVFGKDSKMHNEIRLTLADPETVEIPKELLKKIQDSPFNRLINLYKALKTYTGQSSVVVPQDRVAAINLLKTRSYAQIKPLLVLMILEPNTFLARMKDFEKYGSTLMTLYKNFDAMHVEIRDLRAMYPYNKDGYWTKHLRGDLKRFIDE